MRRRSLVGKWLQQKGDQKMIKKCHRIGTYWNNSGYNKLVCMILHPFLYLQTILLCEMVELQLANHMNSVKKQHHFLSLGHRDSLTSHHQENEGLFLEGADAADSEMLSCCMAEEFSKLLTLDHFRSFAVFCWFRLSVWQFFSRDDGKSAVQRCSTV